MSDWHTITLESNDATVVITNGTVNIFRGEDTSVPPVEMVWDAFEDLYMLGNLYQGKE